MTQKLIEISDQLVKELDDVVLSSPVTHIYQPLRYARAPHVQYLERYGAKTPREVLLIGMNPGPWGMAQTGVPFGEISFVRDWMGVEAPVGKPENEHPKKPVDGFACKRSEVSGSRLWGWAKERFGSAENFFERFFVVNYCPLLLLSETGANRTPPQLPKAERAQILEPCDAALRAIVDYFDPEFVLGVGAFAEKRIAEALGKDSPRKIGRILHPSPASPIANRGWAEQAEKEFRALGVNIG